jgi:hypothetical protein
VEFATRSLMVVVGLPRSGGMRIWAASASIPLIAKQWKHLWPQEVVELRRGSTVLGAGWVDEATADGTIVWIHLTRGLGRVLVHTHDGIDLWRVDSGVHRPERQSIPAGARQDG